MADDPSPADPRLGVVTTEEEVVLEQGVDLRFSPEEVWAASVALSLAEGEDPQWRWRKAEQERADEARNALQVERTLRRMKAMTESAKRGCPVNIYGGPAVLQVTGPRWLAERPSSPTAAARWEQRCNGLYDVSGGRCE